jgi:hypothetical protein
MHINVYEYACIPEVTYVYYLRMFETFAVPRYTEKPNHHKITIPLILNKSIPLYIILKSVPYLPISFMNIACWHNFTLSMLVNS